MVYQLLACAEMRASGGSMRASGGSLSKGTLVFAQTLLFFALSSSSYEIFQHPPPSSFAYCAHVFFDVFFFQHHRAPATITTAPPMLYSGPK